MFIVADFVSLIQAFKFLPCQCNGTKLFNSWIYTKYLHGKIKNVILEEKQKLLHVLIWFLIL